MNRSPHLVAVTRRALTDTDDPDGIPAADPLAIAVMLLRDSYAGASSHELATRFTTATLAALGEIDKNTVIRVLLGSEFYEGMTVAANSAPATRNGPKGNSWIRRLLRTIRPTAIGVART